MGNKSSVIVEAFLFDVDGTLADTERDGHRPAFNKAFEALGLDWHWNVELYGKLLTVTGGKERIRYYIDHFRPDYVKPADFDGLVAALHKAKTHHYTTMLAEGLIPMRPGVKRLLAEARAAGLRLAVVTTTSPENVTALLQHSLAEDAESWFEVIAAGDIVPAKKPAPDIYRWALHELNLMPEQCVAFEDSGNGLRSSLAAGVRTLVTVNEYTAQDNFDGAIAVLSNLGEPEAPFKVLSGETCGKSFVDVSLIRHWFDS
ncbi:MAG: phosphatase [Methylophilales bacterium RIFCSPHIGHO2_02_FULL_57_10]|nr:MAG: phosphatase [Methylophilales bacterium RIFCSPHIGHO2_02_FULL_57_10]